MLQETLELCPFFFNFIDTVLVGPKLPQKAGNFVKSWPMDGLIIPMNKESTKP